MSSASSASSAPPSGSNRSGWRPQASRPGPFRAHARRAVRLRALVTHVQAGWQHQAPVENIGLGGARIVCADKLAPGDAVTLSFTAPTLWDPLVLRARVAWIAPPGPAAAGTPRRVGLAFEHKNASAVFALYELIATLGYE